MQNEFDKEIDALLRKAAPRDYVAIPETGHMDADEISMFAENALTGAMRKRSVSHMADCARCREILANVVALNAEEGIDFTPAASPAAVIEAEAAPSIWESLFSVRNLALSFGALAVLFAGFLGFTALQTSFSNGTETAQADKQEIANTARPAENANTAVSEEQDSAENKDAESASEAPLELTEGGQNGRDTAFEKAEAEPKLDAGISRGEVASKKANERASSPVATPPVVTEEEKDSDVRLGSVTEMDDAPAAAPPPPTVSANKPVLTTRGERNSDRARESTSAQADGVDAKVEKRKLSTRRTVSGRTFEKRDDGWYDIEYKNQRPTVVIRGTTAYGNLDAGLRAIGNRIPGTVYVIWKSKAYKIQ